MFLAFVLFGSSVVIVLFSLFISLNPDALPGSLWGCLGLLCLRCVRRIKLLSQGFGILLQKVSDVLVLQENPLTHSCARGSLRCWSETGYFPLLPHTTGSRSTRCWYPTGEAPGAPSRCCRPVSVPSLPWPPLPPPDRDTAAGVWQQGPDSSGLTAAPGPRTAQQTEVCCCSCRLCALGICLGTARKEQQSYGPRCF